MKLIRLFIATFALALTTHADRPRLDKRPIDSETLEALTAFLETRGRLGIDDSYSRLGKLYEGAKIYDVWLEHPTEKGSYSGGGMSVLTYGDNIEIHTNAFGAARALLLKHGDKITSVETLRDRMTAITRVTEVKDKGNGVYHVYNGKDFAGEPSGFVVTVTNQKITDCRYKMKLEVED